MKKTHWSYFYAKLLAGNLSKNSLRGPRNSHIAAHNNLNFGYCSIIDMAENNTLETVDISNTVWNLFIGLPSCLHKLRHLNMSDEKT